MCGKRDVIDYLQQQVSEQGAVQLTREVALLRVADGANKILELERAKLDQLAKPRGEVKDEERLAQELRRQHQL